MAEEITPEITKRVAELSRLSLTEAEVERFSAQLASIVNHAGDMNSLDLSGVAPTSHPYPLKNVLRKDEPQDFEFSREEVLDAAPDTKDGQFQVPPILGS